MGGDLRDAAVSRLRALARDEKGAAAVVAALLFPVLVGAMGFGAETGYWHLEQRKLQHAADVAAHAAGVRSRAGDGADGMDAAALRVAAASGYLPEIGTLIVTSEAGTAGPSSRIEVVLTEAHPRLFSSIFADGPAVIAAKAVSEVTGYSKACVLALSASASGAVTVTGSTTVGLTDCSVASNSAAPDAFNMEGAGSRMTTDCVYAAGEAVYTEGLAMARCSAPVEHAPVIPDPYADVQPPSDVELGLLECTDPDVISAPGYSMNVLPDGTRAMKFCEDVFINRNVVLEPGLYVMANSGVLTVGANSSLQGLEGVTFYFDGNASAQLNGSGDTDLKAPTAGRYEGILFFGDREAPAGVNHLITGNSGSSFQGSLYMPASHITFTGNSSVSGACTQIVADSVTFTGNSTIETGCTSGIRDILVGGDVSLVE